LPGARPRITQGWATSVASCIESLMNRYIGIDVSKREVARASDFGNATIVSRALQPLVGWPSGSLC
jgi:hypothetical protein